MKSQRILASILSVIFVSILVLTPMTGIVFVQAQGTQEPVAEGGGAAVATEETPSPVESSAPETTKEAETVAPEVSATPEITEEPAEAPATQTTQEAAAEEKTPAVDIEETPAPAETNAPMATEEPTEAPVAPVATDGLVSETQVNTYLVRFYDAGGKEWHSIAVAEGEPVIEPDTFPEGSSGMKFAYWYQVDEYLRGDNSLPYNFKRPITGATYLMAHYSLIQPEAPPAADQPANQEQEAGEETPAAETGETPAPEESVAPEVTEEEAEATATPEATEEPAETPAVYATHEPVAGEEETPAVETEETPAPEESVAPEATEEPTETPIIQATQEPVTVEETPAVSKEATPAPEVTEAVEETITPETTEETEASPTSEATETTEEPSVQDESTVADPLTNETRVFLKEEIDAMFPDRKISFYASWGAKPVPENGDEIILTAELSGYEGLVYSIRWQVLRTQTEGWVDYDVLGDKCAFTLSPETIDWSFRVAVDILDVE